MAIEPLLLACTRVSTFDGSCLLTVASGFFFERGGKLFLVTSRHVVSDPASGHAPNRIELDLHPDKNNLARAATLSIDLYDRGIGVWRQTRDMGGEVDVAAVEIHREVLAGISGLCSFTEAQLPRSLDTVPLGGSVLIPGFPLGFHDALHHLPVVRQACIASSFGLRFQGQGIFLTDARTHRGSSGAPVVMRGAPDDSPLAWTLLGVHSSRMDMSSRDPLVDESLGLNCAWYADVLLTLTEP